MSELCRPMLAPLPFLLWQPPPGLELILAQEGIAFETVRDPHPFAFRRGRFVLFDSKKTAPATIRGLLTHAHVVIDIDLLRQEEPVEPFGALVDNQGARGSWRFRRWTVSEQVARAPKAWIRRRLIEKLRELVTGAGGVWIRLAPYPYPFRSAFNLRVDLDEPAPEDYHRFALTRNLLGDCCTHFVSTNAYEAQAEILEDLLRFDTQSHGHFHYVYRDAEANRHNLERAHDILSNSGFEPEGFTAPHGRWNPGLDEALEALGYLYSSDFQLGHDELPFFPWLGDRFSRVLQVPVHPVCEGLFLDAGVDDATVVADYLRRVVEEKLAEGEPAFVYGHPERRLGRMPEVLIALSRLLAEKSLVWRTTMTEFARWWLWRGDRNYLVIPRVGNRFEIQFDEWDRQYPLALEINRGRFRCLLPITGPRMLIDCDDLVYERHEASSGPIVVPPRIERRPPSLRDAVRLAIDWETVTPIEELNAGTLTGRVKKGLRWWKHQQARTG